MNVWPMNILIWLDINMNKTVLSIFGHLHAGTCEIWFVLLIVTPSFHMYNHTHPLYICTYINVCYRVDWCPPKSKATTTEQQQ